MRKSVTAALTLSECREKLNDLNALTDSTKAQQTDERALLATMKTTEVEYRQALTDEANEHATATGDPADVEYREIVGRSNVGNIMTAYVEHRQTDGAEAEIQQHRGLNANQIPLDLLRLPAVETRAVTTGPPSVETQEQPTIMPIFAAGVGAFIGADRPTVDAGLVAYPVLDQRPTVGGPHTDSTAVDETDGSFSSDLLTPGRVQSSYFYRRVDAARFPSIDMALRQSLNGGLEEKLDYELLAGAAGLLSGTNLSAHAAGASVTSFSEYLSLFGHARVDGRMAASLGDVRTVTGSATYAHMGGAYRSNNADYSSLDAVNRVTGGVRVSAHVPAVAGHKQNAVIRLGSHDRAVIQVLWDGVTLVPDEISKVKTGEIAITAILLVATKILRSDSFPQAGSTTRRLGADVAVSIVAGPGCDALKDDYVERERQPGDLVISVGRLFESLTGDASVPSSNPAALRAALALRTTAIRLAREKRIDAYVLTSNGNRADLDKLRELTGADEIRVLAYTEAQACARIRALVPAGERREACELGIRSRWFARYEAAPTDRAIRPGAPEEREVEMREVETGARSIAAVEIRETDEGERLTGVLLQEGRAASVRPEVFAPGALVWSSDGIAIRTEHRGREVARAIPTRGTNGEIRISALATPEIRAAYASGKRYLSAEFQSLAEIRTRANVREIQRAFVGVAALVREPEYTQATAEVRARARRRQWL